MFVIHNVSKALKVITAASLALTMSVIASQSADATPRRNEKVTICHRTHATTNPYRMITVSMSSIIGNGQSGNGHGDTTTGGGQDDPAVTSDHSHNPYLTAAGPVFNPTYNYPANQKKWQDIIPPFNYVPANGNPGSFPGLNWTAEGKAIYYGYEYNGRSYAGLCSKLSAKEFAQKEYDSFLADNPNANAGAKNSAKNNAAQDVKDQGAIEDGNTNGKNFDTLPNPAQKPSGPKRPAALKQLQDQLDSTNQGQQNLTQAISGVVWLDADRDGVQDDSETLFENVEIQLFDPVTNQIYQPVRVNRIGIATVTEVTVRTDANGYFQLDNVPEGDWIVKVVTPSGYTYTYDSAGTNDGQMPGTYVPSGGIGFAWAGLVTDPNANNNSDPNNPNDPNNNTDPNANDSENSLANTGDGTLLPITAIGLTLIGLGVYALKRRKL